MPSSQIPDPIKTILSRVPRSRRAEVERELRAHLEDGGTLPDPEKLAVAFARVYESPWRLFMVSVVVSSAAIVLARVLLGQRYPYVTREILFFAAFPAGYVSARRGILTGVVAALYVAVIAHIITPGEAIGPTMTCIAGAAVCVLQRARVRFAWIWGTAIPLALARAIHGPLSPGNGPLGPWHFGVWLITALSCYAMTRMSITPE